jgi:hypothetical protein
LPITILPPLYFYTGQAWARTASPNADYYLYVNSTEIWKDSSAPRSALSATAKSPVNLFLTDPLNRSIGTDPNTGLFVNEIPHAFYTGPYAEPQNIIIPEPLTGNYLLYASGIGSGSYTLTMESVANDFVDLQIWQGNVNAGDQIRENARLDSDGVIVLPHNIKVADLRTFKTVVGRGYLMSANLTIENRGNYTETFNATLYMNETNIAIFNNLTLNSRNWTSLLYEWNTTDFPMGNYTIWAYAWPVRNETNISDNNCTGGWIVVTIPGDVDGNFEVDIYDVTAICICYDSKIGDSIYYPNCDVDGNGIIDIFDVTTACITYGQKYL